MPELSQKCTPSGPAVSPPVTRAEDWEEQPAFRETLLLFFTEPGANATLRSFGRLLHELVLEFWGLWPSHPEGILPAELRAAVADLRHVQGALREWTGPAVTLEDPYELRLASVGADVAISLGELADRLEKELDSRQGEV